MSSSMRSALLFILPAFLITSPLTAGPGVTLHQKQTTSGMMGQPGKTGTSTLYYGEQAMKQSESDGSDFIIDFTGQKTIIIDNKKKTYTETSFDEMREMVERANSELAKQKEQMAEQMKNNPQAAKAFGQLAGTGEVSLTEKGDGGTIAGYATQKYEISMPPMMRIEVWAAPDLKVPEAYYDALKLQTAGANPFIDMGKLFEAMKKIQGLSLKTIVTMTMMGMNMTSSTETTQVDRADIPASVFTVPEGYSRTEFKTN